MTLWEIDIHPAPGERDTRGERIAREAVDLGLLSQVSARSARAFLLEGNLSESHVRSAAERLLVDPVIERYIAARISAVGDDDARINSVSPEHPLLVQVIYHPGVMDPIAESTLEALREMELPIERVATMRKYWFPASALEQLPALCQRLLANASIERALLGPLKINHLEAGTPYQFQLVHVPIRHLDPEGLEQLSRHGQLSLTGTEMQVIQAWYREQQREPTDIELETIAQTWSEHCSHKTLAGPIAFEDDQGKHDFRNMLKETIFATTETIRQRLGKDDWCVSVFKDNAGVVRFSDDYHVTFKVETHNHPSALEPYGGANTGVGGVIRDTLGTGLGARPIANTDVLCFAPPDWPAGELPSGVLHPKRVMMGVVAGIRDYGNRMGIPTVNGAVVFDPRYLGNPLVYCGNVGLLPTSCVDKKPEPGDWIVTVGGRTGRDGIHGATFSSVKLSSDSDAISGGAVQIGNAITEKMLTDVLLAARDRRLYHAVTDCGAGGYSSAVGEMAAELGATVWLDKVPLKYDGLTYTEIWISEAQERMVVAVPPTAWESFRELCAAERVDATIIGRFDDSHELVLRYADHEVGRLAMQFLHDGRPRIVRQAVYQPIASRWDPSPDDQPLDWTETLMAILSSWNVASKEWIIRQYDHEVQGSSILKPLVGVSNDGPGDAAVLRPILDSNCGLAISCGVNPSYGDWDPGAMAASVIDEAVRNCVAVGADATRIAILDNFCWGNTDRPEVLGSLVRAALACRRVAEALGTPFISGKDSLNNEFHYEPVKGQYESIAIPGTLLISALGIVPDIRRCVTMDLKRPGNAIYLVGWTKAELGGSQFAAMTGMTDLGPAPGVDIELAPRIFPLIHSAISRGLVQACHDLSDGGLAVALAEMAFAGGWGVDCDLMSVPCKVKDEQRLPFVLLFSESNTRFLCEIAPEHITEWERTVASIPSARIGQVTESTRLVIRHGPENKAIDAGIEALKMAWQRRP